MKYCPHCCTLYERGAICSECKRELKKEISESDPVCMIRADGFERERIVAALRDNGVPCVEQFERKERSADAVTGKLAAKVKIEVPFAAYDKAKDILIGIGAIKLDGEPDESAAPIKQNQEKTVVYSHEPASGKAKKKNKSKKKADYEWEEMPPVKRNVVRLVSALLFIVIVALVIFGTDFIMNIIKGLF